MAKRPRKTWVYSPANDPRAEVSDELKAEVERKANELLALLRPKSIKPPPVEPRVNYLTGLGTKWHGRYFYLVATYACPGPNALSPTFETNFARLEHLGGGRFTLSFMRHTGKWWPLHSGVGLDECLTAVRDDPWFEP
jgi:hypothetical protein